jgi:LmbE family N-acetylglucosaminyl deacetylase
MGLERRSAHPPQAPGRKSRWPKGRWLIALAFLLVLGGAVVKMQAFLRPLIGMAEGLLTLPPGGRILILAPHPDDEVLGCGGLIQSALEQGNEVWIAWMTCGDGPWLAAERVNRKLRPRPADYLRLGRQRQEEARTAARILGVPEDHLFFLGYPDQGLAPLWQTYWERPFRSPHTKATAVPYGNSPHPYLGQQVLADLLDLLGTLQPTRIFTAHPNDAHPDHWATTAFLLLAREVWILTQETPFPEVYAYLVHRWEWPRPKGYHADLDLEPPATLAQEGHQWLTLPLSEAQIHGKARALEAHRSQIRSAKAYLHSFVRSNELFEQLIYPPYGFSSHLWQEGESIAPEASTDTPTMKFLPGAEVNAIEVRADEQRWDLRLSLGGHMLSRLTYRLFLHSLGKEGTTLVHRKALVQLPTASASSATLKAITPLPGPPLLERPIPCRRLPDEWEVQIPRSWFAPSQVLLYGAEVRWHHWILDRTSLSCWRNPAADPIPGAR